MKTTYRHHIKSLASLMLLATTVGLTSCSVNDQAEGSSNAQGTITFTVDNSQQWKEGTTRAQYDDKSVTFEGPSLTKPLYLCTFVTNGMPENGATTRGTRVNTKDDLSSFGVSAYKVGQSEDVAGKTPSFFYNLKAVPSGDDYAITQNYFWPAENEKLVFYAYYPYNSGKSAEDDNTDVTLSPVTATGAQTIAFTVNEDITKQVDLMTAVAESQSFNETKSPKVAMNFSHELCAVKFQIGQQFLAGGIVSIAIKNVYGSGTMTIGAAAAQKWASSSLVKNDFLLRLNKSNVAGTNEEQIMDDGQYFLMIPQTLPDDAVVELVYQDGMKNYTVTASLKGETWQAGTTVTYAISSTELTTLKLGNINWPSNTDWKGPKTAFANGDELGLYVVDADNNVKYRNIHCSYNGSTWTIDHPTGETIYKLPDYKYFVYYPYKEEYSTAYPLNDKGAATTADAFFSTIIDGWNPVENQNPSGDTNGTTFYKQDLQVAMATDNADGLAATIDANMAHKMDLAIVTLKTKHITDKVIYGLPNNDPYQWTHQQTETDVTASAEFDTNIPYYTDSKYYFVFKPGTTATRLKGLRSGSADWSYDFISSDRGIAYEYDAYTARENSTANQTYTLALGDIYYSNGAVSHSRITGNSCYGTPIGVVVCIGSGAMVENRHALVMAGKEAAMGKWSKDMVDIGGISNTSGENAATSYGGLSNTVWFNNQSNPQTNYPAAYNARHYNVTYPSGFTTGWFLASSGQWAQSIQQCGTPLTGWNNWVKPEPDLTAFNTINTYLAKLGSGNYTALSKYLYTTSSEFSAERELHIIFWDNYGTVLDEDIMDIQDDLPSEDNKQFSYKVRPFLAF